MAEKPKLTLRFRAGPRSTAVGGARPEDITAEVEDKLRRMAKKVGLEELAAALFTSKDAVLREIRVDATRFAENAAKVMTRVRSPTTGSIYVSVDDVNRNFVGSSSFEEFKAGSRLVEGSHTVVSWNALTARTLARKRGRQRGFGPRGSPETFFVDSGQLRSLLITYLGPAFAMLIDPQIIFTRKEEGVTVTLTVMAKNAGFAKRGVGKANAPFLASGQAGNAASAGNENLMVSYLQAAGARDPKLAAKLTNPRGIHRPFLQPVLAYWLTTRLPIVLERALLKALKSRNFTGRVSNRTV